MTKKDLPASLLDLVRPTLMPCTVATPQNKSRKGTTLPAAATKFGGTPYAERGDEWPMCGCGRPLAFVFQWNLAECPHAAGQRGAYSFYYCFSCNSWGDVPKEAVDAWLVRVHPEAAEGRAAAMEQPEWPDEDEVDIRSCGVELSLGVIAPDWESVSEPIAKACEAVNPESMWEAYEQAAEQLGGNAAAEATTRIGGHPRWIQGEATPDCPTCGKPTEFIAEIGSEDDAGLMWGDSGSVYLFECGTHRGTFAMQLQCF